jgi:hypothetical protein
MSVLQAVTGSLRHILVLWSEGMRLHHGTDCPEEASKLERSPLKFHCKQPLMPLQLFRGNLWAHSMAHSESREISLSFSELTPSPHGTFV